jgi:hypothetical protein
MRARFKDTSGSPRWAIGRAAGVIRSDHARATRIEHNRRMKIPLQITFEDMPAFETIETKIRQRVARLARFSPRIVRCQVWVLEPQRGRSICCLPVVEKDRLVGIVTTTDLLDLIGRGAERPIPKTRRWVLKDRGPRGKPAVGRGRTVSPGPGR